MPRSSSGIASPADFCAWRREEKLSSTVPAEMVLRYQISRRVSTPSLNQSDIAVLRAQMTDDLKATWDSRATARHFPEALVTTTTTTTICLSSCSCWVVRVIVYLHSDMSSVFFLCFTTDNLPCHNVQPSSIVCLC